MPYKVTEFRINPNTNDYPANFKTKEEIKAFLIDLGWGKDLHLMETTDSNGFNIVMALIRCSEPFIAVYIGSDE